MRVLAPAHTLTLFYVGVRKLPLLIWQTDQEGYNVSVMLLSFKIIYYFIKIVKQIQLFVVSDQEDEPVLSE